MIEHIYMDHLVNKVNIAKCVGNSKAQLKSFQRNQSLCVLSYPRRVFTLHSSLSVEFRSFPLPEIQRVSTLFNVYWIHAHSFKPMFSWFVNIFFTKTCFFIHIFFIHILFFCKFHMVCTPQPSKIWWQTSVQASVWFATLKENIPRPKSKKKKHRFMLMVWLASHLLKITFMCQIDHQFGIA